MRKNNKNILIYDKILLRNNKYISNNDMYFIEFYRFYLIKGVLESPNS